MPTLRLPSVTVVERGSVGSLLPGGFATVAAAIAAAVPSFCIGILVYFSNIFRVFFIFFYPFFRFPRR